MIVITHLPQVAAMADAHYRLVKGLDADGRATTRIEPVAGEALVDELVPDARGRPAATPAPAATPRSCWPAGPERAAGSGSRIGGR